MNVSVSGTVIQVAFATDETGAAGEVVVKLEAGPFGIIDLILDNPALVAELAAEQPTAEVVDPAGGLDAEGKPNTKIVFSGKHPKDGQPFSAQFSI